MKKFLIFLTSIIVVISVGLVTFYFLRNDEQISLGVNEVYCNVGDSVRVDTLGLSVTKPSKKTKYDYIANESEIGDYITYNADTRAYEITKAGNVDLEISTTNSKFGSFIVTFHIGDGTKENPFFVFTEKDLQNIGSTDILSLDKTYQLMNDIAITTEFSPIGASSSSAFTGTLVGNGYTIKGLKITSSDSSNAGLFYALGAKANVQNLTIKNAEISGSFSNAGVLAGTIAGTVNRVAILNSTISNSKDAGKTGALAGVINSNINTVYANGVDIEVAGSNVSVGGLFGEVGSTSAQPTILATYANGGKITLNGATGAIGGFAGKFYIKSTSTGSSTTQSGSIQQCYANTTCEDSNFATFIGEIKAVDDYSIKDYGFIRHLIGNFAIGSTTDSEIVKTFDSAIFKNVQSPSNSVFYSTSPDYLYLVQGFESADTVTVDNLTFYTNLDNTTTKWDANNIWNDTSLPTLKMTTSVPSAPSAGYFNRSSSTQNVNDSNVGDSLTGDLSEDKAYELTSDITVDNLPTSLTNTTLNGKNHKITVNNGTRGLFETISGSTVKDVEIVVKEVAPTSNLDYYGALANVITSSELINVKITFADSAFGTATIKTFGGIAGKLENSSMKNCSVSGINMTANTTITNAGGLVGEMINSSISDNNTLSISNITAKKVIGGAVASVDESSVVSDITAVVAINKNDQEIATIGGIAGINNGTIKNVEIEENIDIAKIGYTGDTIADAVVSVSEYSLVGGATGTNNGTISAVTLKGAGINVRKENVAIFAAGVAAINNGTISGTNVFVSNIGSEADDNMTLHTFHSVGGLTVVNSGAIDRCVSGAKTIKGNYVAGIAVIMGNANGNTNATVNQVLVANYTSGSAVISSNTIQGNIQVAGMVVDFQNGSVKNVQTKSVIYGTENSTKCSLIVLKFENAATLINSVVDSSFEGNGDRYREVWTDYNTRSGYGCYNLGLANNSHGKMQSVVINTSNKGVEDAKYSIDIYSRSFIFFGWVQQNYQDNADSSYVRYVNSSDFNKIETYQGTFNYVYGKWAINNNQTRTVSREMKFTINSYGWKLSADGGIELSLFSDLD